MLIEIKFEFSTESQLQEIVIETLLWNFYFPGGIVEGVAEEIAVLIWDSVVEPSPFRNKINNVTDPPFFGPFLNFFKLGG